MSVSLSLNIKLTLKRGHHFIFCNGRDIKLKILLYFCTKFEILALRRGFGEDNKTRGKK